MRAYLDLLRKVRNEGEHHSDRTGVTTLSLFGGQLSCDLRDGFPLLTTKKMFTKGIIHELFWFLRGDTNIKYLQDNRVTIWDAWATPEACEKAGRRPGELGPVYGKQMRSFGFEGVDQIENLLRDIENSPNSRRLLVTHWNPADVPKQSLPCCHVLWQIKVHESTREMSLSMYQRSADMFLGVPFNIASYALLLAMIAHVTGYRPRGLTMSFGDFHIYKNHLSQVDEQLSREPMPLPKLEIDYVCDSSSSALENLLAIEYQHIRLVDYKSHPKLEGEVAV